MNIDPNLKLLDKSVINLWNGIFMPRGKYETSDWIGHFDEECDILVSVPPGEPENLQLPEFIGDTALMCYRHLRRRKSYWQDKRLFMKRLFKTVQMAVQRKILKYKIHNIISISVIIIGQRRFWIGSVGTNGIYVFLDDNLLYNNSDSRYQDPDLRNFLYRKHNFVHPKYLSRVFKSGSALLVMPGELIKGDNINKLGDFAVNAGHSVNQNRHFMEHLLTDDSDNPTDRHAGLMVKWYKNISSDEQIFSLA